MKHQLRVFCGLALLVWLLVGVATFKPLLNALPSNTYRLDRAAPQYRDLKVKAYGDEALRFEVVSRVGGVLLQGTANHQLSDSWLAAAKRFFCNDRIAYDPAAPNGQRYKFRYACSTTQLPFTDEFLAPVIEFVASDYTAAVTLLGGNNDPTPAELSRQEEIEARFIVQFHPALKDTLLGNMLLLADAAFVSPDVLGAVELWRKPLTAMYGDLAPANPQIVKSALASVNRSGTKECRSFDSYIVVDVDTKYEWEISNGQLEISGDPYYSFWCEYPGPGMAHHYHKLSVRTVWEGAPYVYESVARVARVAAFLRWFRQASLSTKGPRFLRWLWDSSENWNALVVSTQTLAIEGQETPGFWDPPNSLLEELRDFLMRSK